MSQHSFTRITLTREELYEQVWQKPMRQLAKEYGRSDVGLANICKKHEIPRPGLGYWSKVQFGKKVKRPRLPKVSDPRLETIDFYRVQVPDKAEAIDRDLPPEIAAEYLPENEIVVPESIDNPHPVTVRTDRTLRRSRRDERGIIQPQAKRAARVFVGPSSIDRAMRILDTLIKALESRSRPVKVECEDGRRHTCVDVDGELLEFELTEVVAREEREPTRKEARDKELYSWSHQGPFYRYYPSGRLCRQIVTDRAYGVQRCWADGKKQRVENRLNSFVRSLLWMSREIKERRPRREEEARRRDEWEKKRREKLELIRAEEQRLKALYENVDRWHRSETIRAYVLRVRERTILAHGEIKEDSKIGRWLVWATQQADRMDPLVESPPSVLDEKKKWEYGYMHW